MPNHRALRTAAAAILSGLAVPASQARDGDTGRGSGQSPADEGFVSIFDGKSLAGWESPDLSWWSVEDGAITGRIPRGKPCTINQYLVWTGGDLANFELKLESRLSGEGGINNGFQFRSRVLPDHDVCGYQVDNNLETPWLVRLYDEYGRHTLAWRGERTAIDPGGGRSVEPIPDAAGDPWFSLGEWHEYHLICQGPLITLRVNGRLAAALEDHDSQRADAAGAFALQLHSGPPTLVQFRNIRIKRLTDGPPGAAGNANLRAPAGSGPRAALIRDAIAWWDLCDGGHGASPPLQHFPAFDRFELNVRPSGGRREDSRVVTLDGAHFTGPAGLAGDGSALTVLIRARDPEGTWNAALVNCGRATAESPGFSLGGSGDSGGEAKITFRVQTDRGPAEAAVRAGDLPDPRAWIDLTGRYDGRSLDLFCNGRRVASVPCSGNLITRQEPLVIAAENGLDGPANHFRGEMETAALWNRALTDDEIGLLSR